MGADVDAGEVGVADRARGVVVARVCEGHPLAAVLPLLHDTLVSIAEEARHTVIVTDVGSGTWHSWSCAASPIHDPETGALIGAVDLAGPARSVQPTTLALVAAAARLAEGFLRAQVAMRLLARGQQAPGPASPGALSASSAAGPASL
ncbi:MAG TPA: hypothetical protein VGE11_22680 [Pseudonocardia sp.]